MTSARPCPTIDRIATVACLLALAGCAGEGNEGAAAGSPGTQAPGTVALAPTHPDSLPRAILGTAPPPRGDDVAYVPGDSLTVGYLAVPEGEGPFPGLILVHEWNGLVDRVRQMADAMAAEGYVALAADLYQGRTGSSREENRALTREVRSEMDRVIRNLDHAVDFLRDRQDVTGRVAAMGWCFGGGIALSYGLGGQNHEGTAIFYGSLVDDPERLATLDHPVYGTFGELDTGIPPEEVERFVEALREAGVENDVHVYENVGHGFWLRVDEDPETRRAPALDAWRRLKAYLGEVLRP